mmetsp:Transcript_23485/g.32937  ORF Transcript_23485/g.32937 Transcript_23485/m.32937 type:complete len:471 (+) Transcript_23485:83-1495(+)
MSKFLHHRRNIVEVIVQKIPIHERGNFHVTKPFIDKANEQVRILATKCSVGRLGKGDSEQTRAAIILEYVVRQMANHRFSMEAMASAVSMKTKLFRDLHHKVGNYLPNLTTPPNIPSSSQSITGATAGVGKTKKKHKKKATNDAHSFKTSSNGAGNNNRVLQSAPTMTVATTASAAAATIPQHQQDNIRLLSIRLGTIIQDSHGSATRAKELLKDIETFICNSTSSVLRRDYMYELERNRAVYEAACFYVVSTTTTSSSKRKKRKTNKKKKSSNNTTSVTNNDNDDEKDNTTLSNEDVIRASNISESVFHDILPIVQDFAKQIAIAKKKGKRTTKRKKDPPSSSSATANNNQNQTTKSQKNQHTNSKNNNNRVSGSSSFTEHLVQAIEDGTHKMHDYGKESSTPHTDGVPSPSHVPSLVFTNWKKKVLDKAVQKSKQCIIDETTLIDTIASYEKAMEYAADTVLRKHQLI